MNIGVPKEIKNLEFRVGLNPSSVDYLVKKGHTVLIQKDAGLGANFTNENYLLAGAQILEAASDIYANADLIVKVKEPQKQEIPLIKPNQVIFGYFHFASDPDLLDAMIQTKSVNIAFETVELNDGSLPLLIPMSEVAGRLASLNGAELLLKHRGGKGKLIGGVPGVKPATVTILGAGVVGLQAALMAAGLGADVYLFDKNLSRIRQLDQILPPNVHALFSTEIKIKELLPITDILIGAVLIPGLKAPHLIKKEDLKLMEKGSVILDVAVDQGGCIETIYPTTHENPTYLVDGIIHYGVANIPGSVPITSTDALNNAILPYVEIIAKNGWEKACQLNSALFKGLSIAQGEIIDARLNSLELI